MSLRKISRLGAALGIVASGLCCASAFAQQPRQYTTQDYAAAEKFMSYNVNPLAYKGVVRAQWLDDDRFWYRAVDDSGVTYMVVDPAKGPALRPSTRSSWQRLWPRPQMARSRTIPATSNSL